jgi:hypothetical protein
MAEDGASDGEHKSGDVKLFCPIRVRGRATDRPADPRMGQNLAGIRLGRRFSVKANGPPQARN